MQRFAFSQFVTLYVAGVGTKHLQTLEKIIAEHLGLEADRSQIIQLSEPFGTASHCFNNAKTL